MRPPPIRRLALVRTTPRAALQPTPRGSPSHCCSPPHPSWSRKPTCCGLRVPAGLAVLAIAQMGVHLVFFLHIGTGPDKTNEVLALAFGILIVTLVVGGSLWIMANLDANMIPASAIMEMQR
jgi:cytochrome o ubiquinol oxidase subunit IV